MAQSLKRSVARPQGTDQEMGDQEVLRANKELAAYFKGMRTEREARAALKIIKAFVRERERAHEKRPLPGRQAARAKKPPKTKSGPETTTRRKHPKRRAMAAVKDAASHAPESTAASEPVIQQDERH